MPPSQKRKRKPLPKRPCPCCGSILSEKTIERHASGTHVPTRINVTLAVAAQDQAKFQGKAKFQGNLDVSEDPDLSGDSSDLDSTTHPDPTNADHHGEPELHLHHDDDVGDGEPERGPTNAADHPHNHDAQIDTIIQKTWSGWRSDTEDEDEDYEGNGRVLDPDSDEESDFEWEEKGQRNRLGIDDLIDEDLQRIIAEFSTLFPRF
jgi:hypothetical protein